jgi:hypothetical protein
VKLQLDKLTDHEKKQIDIYYGEAEAEVKVDVEVEAEGKESNKIFLDKDFQGKLNSALKKMNLPKDNDYNVPNSFFSIINNAEKIKAKKSLLKETIIFIAIAFLVLFIFAVSIFIIGQKFLIITEITIFILLPLSIIPFYRSIEGRGESK